MVVTHCTGGSKLQDKLVLYGMDHMVHTVWIIWVIRYGPYGVDHMDHTVWIIWVIRYGAQET